MNVRLDDDRLRKVEALRAAGTPISTLIREAIDQRYKALSTRSNRRNVDQIMKRLFAEHPDPKNLPARKYDLHNRDEARRAIMGRLKRKPR